MTPTSGGFGRDYLQERITGEFALAKHIGVVVESVDDRGIVLRAPLAPNANYKGTAFGGSLYSVAVLTGWAWVTYYLATRNLAADAVIQESTMRFLARSAASCGPAPRRRRICKSTNFEECCSVQDADAFRCGSTCIADQPWPPIRRRLCRGHTSIGGFSCPEN